MKDLGLKCHKEKYFQSIKIFFHTLPNESKLPFLLEVASNNIYLAAHCTMTDKIDIDIENQIKESAITAAKDFSNANKSSLGFLALAEFELYDRILLLFNSIEKPTKTHIIILNQIFLQADEIIFLNFLKTLTGYQRLGSILMPILSYKNPIPINSYSIKILNKFFGRLLEEKYSGYLITFFDRYSLWDNAEILFNNELEELVNNLIKGDYKDLKLALNLCDHHDLGYKYSSNIFISLFSKINNKKSLGTALRIAISNNIYNNSDLNDCLKEIILKKKNNPGMEKYLILKGLINYLEFNSTLKENFYYNKTQVSIRFQKDNFVSNKRGINSSNLIARPIGSKTREIPGTFVKVYGNFENYSSLLKKYSLQDFWNKFFEFCSKTKFKPSIELFLFQSRIIFNTDFREICKVLKTFQQRGIIKIKKEYGYYVSPLSFNSKQLCFLHPLAIGNIDPNKNEKKIIGHPIDFYIVGFNEESSRINVSLVQNYGY